MAFRATNRRIRRFQPPAGESRENLSEALAGCGGAAHASLINIIIQRHNRPHDFSLMRWYAAVNEPGIGRER
ncbi:MAG TPA: hypothetical protein VGL82_15320 [Bryobacteraceae bacterium]|jgi:hypothetical protein